MSARAPIAPNGAPPESAGARLLTAGAIRMHCSEVAREAMDGRSALFRWRDERLPQVAAYVVDVIRERYPDLKVPIHSRWRHIEAGGVRTEAVEAPRVIRRKPGVDREQPDRPIGDERADEHPRRSGFHRRRVSRAPCSVSP